VRTKPLTPPGQGSGRTRRKREQVVRQKHRQARKDFVRTELQCVQASLGNLQENYSAETASVATLLNTAIGAVAEAFAKLGS
jgi:hypothetical protein